MGSDSRPDITLSSPSDAIGAVPYLVGYHPADAVVAIGLCGTTIEVTAVIPLSDLAEMDASLLLAGLRQTDADAAMLIGYGEPAQVTPGIDRVRRALADADIELVDALRVTGNRYWSYVCPDERCCPADGTVFDIASSVTAAAFTRSGSIALSSREEMAAQLDPVTGDQRAAMDLAGQAATTRLASRFAPFLADDTIDEQFTAAGIQLLRRVLDSEELPSLDDTAELGIYISSPTVRAAAVGLIDHGDCLRVWIWLVRHLDDDTRWIAAGLAAYAAWRTGNGALASEASRLSLTDNPGPNNTLARIVALALENGVPPTALPPVSDIPSPASDPAEPAPTATIES